VSISERVAAMAIEFVIDRELTVSAATDSASAWVVVPASSRIVPSVGSSSTAR
jgi:hypothetical protein